jgi:hypothetical protein
VIFSRIALGAGLLLLVGLCVLASIGFTAVIAPLVTIFVLLVLIACGSLLFPRPPG